MRASHFSLVNRLVPFEITPSGLPGRCSTVEPVKPSRSGYGLLELGINTLPCLAVRFHLDLTLMINR